MLVYTPCYLIGLHLIRCLATKAQKHEDDRIIITAHSIEINEPMAHSLMKKLRYPIHFHLLFVTLWLNSFLFFG
ncbi:MAG: hypothetical protein DRG87_04465 [Deltaproteobacteria bacterium]|nr:MAG: hypothetical protein DRG87_04465 [Deltaproteobacteria bacterium]